MSVFLLQAAAAAADTVNTAVTAAPVVQADVPVIDLIMRGGWIMLPLVALSILSVYIIIERYFTIRRAAATPRRS
jgi:biopolymer transport protein ExbB